MPDYAYCTRPIAAFALCAHRTLAQNQPGPTFPTPTRAQAVARRARRVRVAPTLPSTQFARRHGRDTQMPRRAERGFRHDGTRAQASDGGGGGGGGGGDGNGNGDTVPARTHASLNLLTHSTHVLRAAWRTAVARVAAPAPVALDATAGRGSDTLGLCGLLGPGGVVHSVDLQQAAIDETRERYNRLVREGEGGHAARLCVYRGCHSDLRRVTRDAVEPRSAAVVAYNLGWYPGAGADRSVITRAESTVRSLRSAQDLLAPGGVISVMAYVGHPGGQEEEDAVYAWATGLCSKEWTVVYVKYPNRNLAPTLFLCERSQ